MDLRTKLGLIRGLVRWRLTWAQHDLDYRPPLASAKFLSARQAAARVPDGATVFSSGMAGNHRNSIFFWALRDRFLRRGTPRGLTWITVGAQGGRGRVPGTLEDLALPGLVTRFITGHAETVKAMLRLADAGLVELHVMPQGVQTLLLEALGRGEDSVVSQTGCGSFLDPRVGRGTAVLPGAAESFVAVDGDRLRYRLPPLDVSMFVATAADPAGNVTMRNSCMVTEVREATRATRRNGGTVLASVAEIVPRLDGDVFLGRDEIDGIVVHPLNEQLAGVRQREYLPACTVGAQVDPVEAVARLRFINDVLRITPRRGPVDQALARLAADRFTRAAHPGAVVNIGVGHPEEVCRLFFETGLAEGLTFTSETGVYGGLPAPGIFFGASINPERFISSAEMFHLYEEKLDVSVLGLLQADGAGNVNVSRRGAGAINYVGPGGLPDIVASARTIIFVGTWMAGAELALAGGRLQVRRRGQPKFVPAVDEITFNGREALRRGKQVYYVTNVGVFHLTARGMTLVEVMPGVDVRRDIVEGCAMPVVVPGEVPVVAAATVTGEAFALRWRPPTPPAVSAPSG
ncbi:MAG TPA: CoA-transferase [Polyangia bacterium]